MLGLHHVMLSNGTTGACWNYPFFLIEGWTGLVGGFLLAKVAALNFVLHSALYHNILRPLMMSPAAAVCNHICAASLSCQACTRSVCCQVDEHGCTLQLEKKPPSSHSRYQLLCARSEVPTAVSKDNDRRGQAILCKVGGPTSQHST